MIEINFAKVHPDAIIPSKDKENAGYDIYARFDNERILIYPGDTIMIPCGIASSFSDGYVMILKERGSTGTKGIGQRSGVIDSGYRNEWLCPITNHNHFKILVISKLPEQEYYTKYQDITPEEIIFYPYTKAICQALLLSVPDTEVTELSYEELQKIPSKRQGGKLGSTGK